MTRSRALAVLLAGLILLSLPAPVVAGGWRHARGLAARVLTWNIYIGGDILRVVNEPDPFLVPLRVLETVQEIIANDFVTRADAIADEIARTRPHLVGFQEVPLIRIQSPGDFLVGNPVPATELLRDPVTGETIGDFLALILEALNSHPKLVRWGISYRVAVQTQNLDAELPALNPVTGTPLDDVRLTDLDGVLARNDVETSNETSFNYSCPVAPGVDPCVLSQPVGGVEIDILRGFAAVDAKIRGRILRFVNTHFEIRGLDQSPLLPAVQAAQAAQLLAILSTETKPVVVLGDLNTKDDDEVLMVGDLTIVPPYQQFLAAGFVDAWLRSPLRFFDPEGLTCCEPPSLTNTESELFERIDLIFVRNPKGPVFSLAVKVGDDPLGLPQPNWASDHAGVAAQIFAPVKRKRHLGGHDDD